MRVFVFAYDRYDTMTTSRMLDEDGVDHTVLVHTEDARARFVAGGRVKPDRLTVTGEPRGLTRQRNAALDMMRDGEWAVWLVDDLRTVTEVDTYDTRRSPRLGITMANQHQYRGHLTRRIGLDRFMVRAAETAGVCDRFGAHLGGFCGIANPIFRDKKWRFNVLADGRAWVVKKDALRFDTRWDPVDDMGWTATQIRAHGVVVVNQWVLPDCRRYTTGGYGSIEDRTPEKLAAAAHLTATHPTLITTRAKVGQAPGSHVVLRRTLTPDMLRRFERIAAA